jgi:phenylacetyl-CoA:acceptor oxidoreductase subunit 2
MSREAIVAVLLMATGVAAALPDEIFGWIACALALAFAYCQARMLCAARGIPAWREPLVVPLIVVTALAEGGGLLLVAGPWLGAANRSLVLALGVLLLVRWLTWLAYRRRLRTATGGGAALDRAGRVLQLAGSLAPLALLGASALMGDAGAPFAALAGLMAAGAGAYTKLLLITRAGYNQGFALARLPVRGVRP